MSGLPDASDRVVRLEGKSIRDEDWDLIRKLSAEQSGEADNVQSSWIRNPSRRRVFAYAALAVCVVAAAVAASLYFGTEIRSLISSGESIIPSTRP